MSSKKKSSVEEWMKFFKEAGIPKDYVTNYAIIFNNHRMRMDMLQDLNKDVLHDMGIKTMGDVIAIMRHAKDVVEKETRSKILASSGRSRSSSSSPTGTPVRKVARTVVDDGPVIIDRRSAANLPSNSETVIKRSIVGARMAVTTAKHRQEVLLQDRIGLKTASNCTNVPVGSGIPASLARRLGPVDKRPITAPGSDQSAVRRIVTGFNSGDGISGHSFSSDLPSPQIAPKRVITIGNGNSSSMTSNNSVFSRLGAGSSAGKITATVKPTTVVRKSLGRESGAPYSVHDRLGNKMGSSIDTSRKIVGDLRVKSDSSLSQRQKMVSLKKSVFDRLN